MTDRTLRQFTGYGMKRAFNVIQSDLNAVLRPFGLRMVSFSALAVIGETPGLRQSALADSLRIERPNLVLIIDDLERADLIVRERAENDRRAYKLNLTIRGRRTLDQAIAAVQEHDNRLTNGLSVEEREALFRALARIERNGEKEDEHRAISKA